jgi:hypothetical protein
MPSPADPAGADAARALLAEDLADPASRADFRFVFALYAATLDGRGLTAGEVARAAALPERQAATWLEEYREAGMAERDPDVPPDPPRYRLSEKTRGETALVVEALTLAAIPVRAAAPPPPQARPRAPPGWQW